MALRMLLDLMLLRPCIVRNLGEIREVLVVICRRVIALAHLAIFTSSLLTCCVGESLAVV